MALAGFDPKKYWQQRVGENAGLGVVGHRSLGPVYNRYIYKRRIEVVTEVLKSIGRKPESMRILDIGCGSGFYTAFWKSLKVAQYVGVDISPGSISKLSGDYPEYRFVHSDISVPLNSQSFEELGEFDIITVFDVFYHITDNADFANSVKNIGRLLSKSGSVIIFDQLLDKEYMLTSHVKFRNRVEYEQCLQSAGMETAAAKKLFQILVPPVFGTRAVDTLIAGAYKTIGVLMKRLDSLADFMGSAFYKLDQFLLARGCDISNHEVFIVKKNYQQAAGQKVKSVT